MILGAVVVAGGSGARFGRQKQFDLLRGRSVIDWSIDAMLAVADHVVVVVPSEAAGAVTRDDVVVAIGGATRSESVRSGLAALASSVTHVLVHDAARPLASSALVNAVVDALAKGAAGAVPVIPVTDTLRRVGGGHVDRTEYVGVQTPQGFDLAVLRAANESGIEATDDASLLDLLGVPVVHTEGDPANLKITVPHDLSLAEVLFDVVQS
ncbi:MAG: IspD/TarI family cytidylyltransferase [Acidimicrobiales bacterium]